MEGSALETSASSGDLVANMDVATRFLNALFEPTDTILFRPIETWTEDGKKRSKTDFKRTCHRAPMPLLLQLTLEKLFEVSSRDRLNLFFGVCPRFGCEGKFDLAWQIRTARAMWVDIDHISVEDALARVAKAGLPPPSIVVNSGNGAHLYWLLEQPYLIDDAGDPPPVLSDWQTAPDGKRTCRKYILEHDERLYLDKRSHLSRLSPKAHHLQDVVAGIAKAVGGDSTSDLSRLLRIPGSFNRKDERNGKPPVLTELVECDPTRRYPLALFESSKTPSPDTERAKKIQAMPLPKRRKPSAQKADKLAELIAISGIAPAGARSEADFAMCCYAIRHGVDPETVWTQVEAIGKFAEGGRRYFDHTWANAEYEARVQKLEKLEKQCAVKSVNEASHVELEAPVDDGSMDHPVDQEADGDEKARSSRRPVIRVDTAITEVGETMHAITNCLLAAGDCFHRADQLVVIHGATITPILSSAELAGLLNQHVEFYFAEDEGGEFKPLPANYGNTWLNRCDERSRLPAIELFTRNPVYAEDWRLVAPGYDAKSGIYYAGPEVAARDDTKHLDELLTDFCFPSPGDRTNYIGMLLTSLLVPRFIGSKPAVLFNGNQPELGKSILAQIIAILRDGSPVETATYNPNDEEFEKRLGSIVRRGASTIIIDNAKSRSRSARIESACLERSITDPILSFRLLGQSTDIRAENSHTFCITANSPDVSRDLVTRSVVVNLFHEGDPSRRSFSIADPEGYAQEHRLELLGELVGMVERWKAGGMRRAAVHSRFNKRGWGTIVGGILEANGEPDFLANTEDAATSLDETRRDFTELVGIIAHHPRAKWTATDLVALCMRHALLTHDLGEGSPRSLATRIGTIAGRFVDEHFALSEKELATFKREGGRKGMLYRVSIDDKSAEP